MAGIDFRKTLSFGLVAGLFIASFVFYHWLHLQVHPIQYQLWLQSIWNVLIGVTFFVVAAAIGGMLFKPGGFPPLATLGLQLLTGWVAITAVVLAIGSLIGIHVWAWRMVFGLFALLLFRQIQLTLAQSKTALQPLQPIGKLQSVIFLLVGWGALVALVLAVAPPLNYDSLVYHLALPQEYLRAGRISIYPENFFSSFSQYLQMVYLVLMILGSTAPVIFSWMLGILALLIFWEALAGWFTPRAAWVGLAILTSATTVFYNLTREYTENAALLVGALALVALVRWSQSQKLLFLIVLGSLIGFAYGLKPSYGVMALPFMMVVLLIPAHSMREKLRNLLFLGGSALMVSSPWLLRSTLYSGNPFFPVGWPAKWMTPTLAGLLNRAYLTHSWWDTLLFPVKAPFFGFEDRGMSGFPNYAVDLGFLLLLFGLFSWVGLNLRGEKEQTILRNSLWVSLFGLIAWAGMTRISYHVITPRFYVWLFPSFAVAALAGYQTLLKAFGAIGIARKLLTGLVVGSMASGLVSFCLFAIEKNPLPVIAGLRTQQSYLEANLFDEARAWDHVLTHYPPQSVRMLFIARGYYCSPVCIPDTRGIAMFNLLREKGSFDAIAADWRSAGYSYLMVNFSEFNASNFEFSAQMKEEYSAFVDWAAELPVEWEYEDIQVLRLVP